MYTKGYSTIDDFDYFFDSLIEELWERTEYNLSHIREYINNEIKQLFVNLLVSLQYRLENLINKYVVLELNELIRNITECQTAITIELEKICRWFQRSNSSTINDFQIDLALDASITVIKRIYINYSALNIEISNNSISYFNGEYFAWFTTFIQIVLDNVISYSELDERRLRISIDICEANQNFSFKITNNISETANISDLNGRIANTIRLLAEPHNNDKTRLEGGSGYLKIRKILTSDLFREKPIIKLSEIGEDRVFHAEIQFETDYLIKAQ
jgi:hypothetical protein